MPMPTEAQRQLAAVTRRVFERPGSPPTAVAVLNRYYRVDAATLWTALSDPRFAPGITGLTADLRRGARYQSESASGTILLCEEARYLRATWEMDDVESWVSLELTPEPPGVRLELQHEVEVGKAPWDFAYFGWTPVMLSWEILLRALDRVLADPSPIDPDEFAAWFESPDGREFVRGVSVAWGKAAIDGGTDESIAAGATNRAMQSMYNNEVRIDPMMAQGMEIVEQERWSQHISSASADVRAERDRCTNALLRLAAQIVRGEYADRDVSLGEPTWTIDPRQLLPADFLWNRREIARFDTPDPQVYRLAEDIEYQLATLRFPVMDGNAPTDAVIELVLPIRQVGHVIRDEVERVDRIEMTWSIPSTTVELVHWDPERSPVENINQVRDENAKIVVGSHLGRSEALRKLKCSPDVQRSYPLTP